jgi:hypothetical protein
MLARKATDDPPRIAWHIPPLLSTEEMREGHEKRRGTLDWPLAMGRCSGATLALRLRPRIYTPHKVKTLEAYPILPRPWGLHPAGALTHTPRKSNTKASRGPSDDQAKSPVKSKTRRTASGGVSLLLLSLGGYCRVSLLGVPKLRWKTTHCPPKKVNQTFIYPV